MIAGMKKPKAAKKAGRPARTDSPKTLNLRVSKSAWDRAKHLAASRSIPVSELFEDMLAKELPELAGLDDAARLLARAMAILNRLQASETPRTDSPKTLNPPE